MSKIIGFDISMKEYITYDSSTYDPTDKWSRQSTDTKWSFSHAIVTYEYTDANLYLTDDEEIPGLLYLVSVIYNTGDSFGRDIGKQIEHLAVYVNYEDALNLQKLVIEQDEACKKYNRGRYGSNKSRTKFEDTLMIPNGNGTETKLAYIPWHGYFESLNSVEIYPFKPQFLN